MASKAEKLLTKGRSLEAKGRPDKALQVYRDACRSEPYDPDLWAARADVARDSGLKDEAADALFHVCELYARGGLFRQALPVVHKLLELDPDHSGGKRLLRMLEHRSQPLAPVAPANAPSSSAPPTHAAAAVDSMLAVAAVKDSESATAAVGETRDEVAKVPELAAVAEAPFSGAVVGRTTDPIWKTPPEPQAEPDEVELEIVESPAAATPAASLATPWSPPPGTAPPRTPEPSADATEMDGHALDELSLSERLPTLATETGVEIVLDDDSVDVVQAVASTVSASPSLSDLDGELVRHLVDCGKLIHRDPDENVFRQGDIGTRLYLILAGEVSVLWENRQTRESRELARLRPGAFFGEMALLTNTPRSATVTTVKRSEFLEISRRSVRELVDRDARALKLLMRFFRARLVGTLLQSSPLFRPFTREQRRDLIERFRLLELDSEHVVIAEGGRSDGLFIALVGRLEVLQRAAHKKGVKKGDVPSVLLATLTAGDVFGEMSLLEPGPAIASVRTRVRSWVLFLPRADFEAFSQAHPQIRAELEALAAARHEQNRATHELRVEPV